MLQRSLVCVADLLVGGGVPVVGRARAERGVSRAAAVRALPGAGLLVRPAQAGARGAAARAPRRDLLRGQRSRGSRQILLLCSSYLFLIKTKFQLM